MLIPYPGDGVPVPALCAWAMLAAATLGARPARGAETAPADGSADRAARTDAQPTRTLIYRRTNGLDLALHVFEPAGHDARTPRPAIVFFHGGAWRNGDPNQFYWQANYLASRGMVAFSAQYRLLPKHAQRVADCVADAKAALRYVRAHASELGVDPGRIAAGGGSAGGHLAAACAVLADPPEAGAVPARPDLLVLFNPALFHPLAEATLALERFTADTPPAIYFLGDRDEMLKYAQDCLARALQLGNTAELYVAAGQSHGFFNRPPWREATLVEADRFLARHGYLTGEPALATPASARLQRVSAVNPAP